MALDCKDDAPRTSVMDLALGQLHPRVTEVKKVRAPGAASSWLRALPIERFRNHRCVVLAKAWLPKIIGGRGAVELVARGADRTNDVL
eukprot:CAMPEP_0183333024 /NCGR_PEP_ID=MMETSP0164_2-20130417/2034_1 /TAXON_ID=221442 /ORGANISM="Coccolithus pelagicus ssp braarudi, Strain PLY182g" /LENGTH=87 /DNA_ID=CAMNT_0025501849 /DNA_START=686 /DNA_END=946 /DNA_ORIENTATION=-